MAWKPTLQIRVEYEGAEIVWETPDHAMSRYDALMSRHVAGVARTRKRNLERMSDDERAQFVADCEDALRTRMPDDLGELLCDMFMEGVVDWFGVEGPEGGELACNSVTKRQIPYEAKVAIAGLYLQRLRAVEAGKGAPPKPRTSSTASGDQTAAPNEPTITRVADSDEAAAKAP